MLFLTQQQNMNKEEHVSKLFLKFITAWSETEYP